MDCIKIGKLIQKLRKERDLTQKNIADELNISDQAVSKWERGMGCPDISLWPGLSEILGADIKEMLEGELYPNTKDQGNIKKIKFYVCKECGNILTSTGPSSITCCGRKLSALVPHQITREHHLEVEVMDEDYYVTLEHGMEKSHHIMFIALVSDAAIWLNRLYPEQSAETRFPARFKYCTMYAYCSNHGLWQQNISFKRLKESK